MTELTPSRWLLVAGLLGMVIPWITHWSYENLGFPEAFPMVYVYALWFSGVFSLVAVIGGLINMNRLLCHPAQFREVTWTFGSGLMGVASLFMVLLLGLM